MKPIPKSLHTVTVLVAIAREQLARTSRLAVYAPPFEKLVYEDCVDCALAILGLHNMPDTYGLREQAIRKLSRIAS